jgi:prepilin peptidase CpaA
MAIDLPIAGLLLCLLGAAINDLWRFEIEDAWSIAIAVLYAADALLYGRSCGWSHAIAPVVMFAAGLALFHGGWMGGGDVKLLTAVSVWTGLQGLGTFLVWTAIAGGVLVLQLLVLRLLPLPGDLPRVLQRGAPIPYGVAIGAGAVMWLYTGGA